MSYFIFNNVDSRTFGILKRCPFVNKSQKAVTPVAVPDNPVKLYPTTKNREEIVIPCILGIKSRADLRSIYAWLDDTGVLSFSDEPDKYYIVQKTATSSEYISRKFGEIEVTFTCQPFAYAVSPIVLDITSATSYVEVENSGTIFSAPEIRFVPAGDDVTIYLNGAEFSVKNLSAVGTQSLIGREVIIDSEAYVTYFFGDDGLKWQIGDHTYGDYLFLHTGTNYIMHGGNVSKMLINARERFL